VEDKLILHEQRVEFQGVQPLLRDQGTEVVELPDAEPLRKECEHFIHCIEHRQQPLTDAESGVRVLKVLEACQKSMDLNGKNIIL
jgi:UDP-2-acetamido-3-amino-2,3-dideoxy-glucuronate N-acetyltransferase